MALKIVLTVLASLTAIALIAYVNLLHLLGKVPKLNGHGIRVACVGDSITQGIGVILHGRKRNSYPALLQAMLGNEYEVLNFGHTSRALLQSSYFPYQKSPFFAASQKADPAIVLIMLGTNDSQPRNWNAADYERQLAELVTLYRNLPSRPSVYLLIPPAVFIPEGKRSAGFRINRAILEKEIAPAVRHVAEQMNTPVIDILSATRDHPEYFPDGVHPNIMGNRTIAELVFISLCQSQVEQEQQL